MYRKTNQSVNIKTSANISSTDYVSFYDKISLARSWFNPQVTRAIQSNSKILIPYKISGGGVADLGFFFFKLKKIQQFGDLLHIGR